MKLQYKRYQIPLEVMDTPNKRNQGMMGRKNLQGGMLFIFPHIQELSFWMKNCLISLDIIFIIDNNITHIERNALPCTYTHCPHYVGIGNKVVELPAGMVEKMGVEKGDEVLFI
jgi:uncharacterized membrane protein (UPF0127 family)